jgi:hypothetical protein
VSITADKVSVVIPTRGNVDMTEILDSLAAAGFEDVIVWDNSKRENLGIYARFAAIAEAKHDVIATQSDDVVVTHWDEILAAYEPGVVTINYPQDWDIPWICCGTVFDKGAEKKAFDLYFTAHEDDHDFRFFICDGIFALLALPRKVLAYPYKELPWANDSGRVSTERGWYDDKRQLIGARCDGLVAA